MIAYTHAIVDPGAVMVESLYTLVANAAVTGSLRPDYLTVWTQQDRVKVFQHGLQIYEL